MSKKFSFNPLFPANPKEKLGAPRTLEVVLTGRGAQRSLADRLFRWSKGSKDVEIATPVDKRGQRRWAEANDKRELKKGRRAFVRREWAKERATNDLAQLFNIVDRRVPATPDVIERASKAIGARVKYLVEQDQKRWEREFRRLEDTTAGNLPDSVLSREQAWAQLRGIAERSANKFPKVR